MIKYLNCVPVVSVVESLGGPIQMGVCVACSIAAVVTREVVGRGLIKFAYGLYRKFGSYGGTGIIRGELVRVAMRCGFRLCLLYEGGSVSMSVYGLRVRGCDGRSGWFEHIVHMCRIALRGSVL